MLGDRRVTVHVYDCAPERRPQSGRPGLLGTRGRGLGLVAACADDWAAVSQGSASRSSGSASWPGRGSEARAGRRPGPGWGGGAGEGTGQQGRMWKTGVQEAVPVDLATFDQRSLPSEL